MKVKKEINEEIKIQGTKEMKEKRNLRLLTRFKDT